MKGRVALLAEDGTLHMPRPPEPDENLHVQAASESEGDVIANGAVG
jgi:hypothetical protein